MNPQFAATALSPHRFHQVVCLRFEGGWRYIECAKQALCCHRDDFVDHADPSCQRAQSKCMSCLNGQLGIESAKSALNVAAMAAGIAFEVADSLAVAERHVEEAATDGLMTVLFDDDQERSGPHDWR